MDDFSALPSQSDSATDELFAAIAEALAAGSSGTTTTAPNTLAPSTPAIPQNYEEQPVLETWRVPPSLFVVFAIFYAAVFFCGLVGNCFVVAAIAMNKSLRTTTDWLISSLAVRSLAFLPITIKPPFVPAVGRFADSGVLLAQHFVEQFAHRLVFMVWPKRGN